MWVSYNTRVDCNMCKVIRKLIHHLDFTVRTVYSLMNSAVSTTETCYIYKYVLMIVPEFALDNAWI
jgi:hypothetical protein